MSNPALPDQPDDAAPLPAPPASGERVAREIADELADHVACSASSHAQGGEIAADEAARRALAEFGDVPAIQRRCWWIQQGDQIMRRVIVIGLIVLAVAVLAGILMPALAKLSEVGKTVDELNERMASLNATQHSLLEFQQASAQPLEIRGRAYLGEPARPAANADIEVWQLDDMKIVRDIKTDADGAFSTGPLPQGQYFLLASLIGEGNPMINDYANHQRNWPMFRIQSQPIGLYRGGPTPNVELDLQFAGGTLSLELANDVPDEIPLEDTKIRARAGIVWIVRAVQAVSLPVSLERTPPMSWPAVGNHEDWWHVLALAPSELAGRRVARFATWPFGQSVKWNHGSATLWADGNPDGREAEDAPLRRGSRLPAGDYRVCALIAPALDNLMARQLEGPTSVRDFLEPLYVTVTVHAGHETHLSATVPDGFVSDVRAKLDKFRGMSMLDISNNFDLYNEFSRPREMKLEVVSTLPLSAEPE